MFNLEHAIAEWRQEMTEIGIKDEEYLNELESHLRDQVEQLIARGLTAEHAFKKAAEQIGSARLLKDEFSKLGIAHSGFFRRLKRVLLGFTRMPAPTLSEFTQTGREVLESAREEAPRLNHDFIGTEHVLLGLLNSESAILPKVMARMGLDTGKVRKEIEILIGPGIPAQRVAANIPFTPRAKRALALAAGEAQRLRQPQVSPEHIFLGLVKEGEGVAAIVLKRLGVDINRTRDEIVAEMKLRKGSG